MLSGLGTNTATITNRATMSIQCMASVKKWEIAAATMRDTKTGHGTKRHDVSSVIGGKGKGGKGAGSPGSRSSGRGKGQSGGKGGGNSGGKGGGNGKNNIISAYANRLFVNDAMQ